MPDASPARSKALNYFDVAPSRLGGLGLFKLEPIGFGLDDEEQRALLDGGIILILDLCTRATRLVEITAAAFPVASR
jgi:hypothetical protein